jgi:hypothetical protein
MLKNMFAKFISLKQTGDMAFFHDPDRAIPVADFLLQAVPRAGQQFDQVACGYS